MTYFNSRGESTCMRVNLNFRNWRAVARIIRKPKITDGVIKAVFEIENHDPYTKHGIITFDLIRVATRCVGWSYDAFNPPQVNISLHNFLCIRICVYTKKRVRIF